MSIDLESPPRLPQARERPLLAAKLTIPDVSAGLVRRSRLSSMLDAGTARGVTVVAAPPGFGKTVLVADWARGRPRVAWLTLDDADTDPARFVGYVLAAVRTIATGSAAENLAALQSLPPLSEVDDHFVAAFVNALTTLDDDIVLALDDFHLVVGSPTERLVERLLHYRPPRLHLVVMTRVDPDVALHRLRVAGQLAEIRVADLAFTADETQELMTAAEIVLGDREVQQLVRRTEGWASGLRLAAVSLRDVPDPAGFVQEFAGDDRVVADYLITEVLTRQPEQVRRFLLRTCVVKQICGALADALTGDDDGERMLEELHRSNVFLVALDRRHQWYRWHQMFAELVRSRLRVESPATARELHETAAKWFEANGLPVDAARHAAAAGDWPTVARMVGECALDLTFSSGTATLRSLVGLVPDDVAHDSAEVAVARSILAVEADDLDAVRRMAQLASATAGALPPERRLVTETVALVGSLYVATMTGRDTHGSYDRGNALLARLDDPLAPDSHAHRLARMLLLYRLGAFATCDGRYDEGAPHLRRALAEAVAMDVPYIELSCRAQFLSHDFRSGRLVRARRVAEEVLATADRRGWGGNHNLATTHDNFAGLLMLAGDLGGALQHLSLAAELVRPVDLVNRFHIAFLEGVVLRAQGNVAKARAALNRLCALTSVWDYPDWLEPSLRTAQADQLAAEGEIDAALEVLAGLDTEQWGASVTRPLGVVHASLLIRSGRPAEARAVLEPWAVASVGRPVLAAVLVTDALAADALGLQDVALGRLEDALAAADAERLVWPFTSAGPALAPLLKERVDVGTAYEDCAVEVLAHCDRMTAAGALPYYVEPLSERELEVLRHLQGTLRNDEIAARLFVSVNTLKTHVKNINRKLGTTDRREAVLKARALGIL